MSKPSPFAWTVADETLLSNVYFTGGLVAARAAFPGRSEASLTGKIQRLGLKRNRPKENTPEIFWSRVDKNGPVPDHAPELGPCWIWTGEIRWDGYGRFQIGGESWPAHRFAYFDTNKSVANDKRLQVCHRCDNRACCNPGHHFLGTSQDNNSDKCIKGRQARGETVALSKLDAEKVMAIRERYAAGGTTYASLAAEYGVDQSAIGEVVTGFTWSHVGGPITKPGHAYKLTDDDVRAIRARHAAGESCGSISRSTGLSPTHVQGIVLRQRRSEVA